MTSQEREALMDLRAYIDRCIIEDRFEDCLLRVGADATAILGDGINGHRFTAGEHGRIVIARR